MGRAYAGHYANDDSLAEELYNAGSASGDRLWRLPMGSYFAEQIASEVADCKNSGRDFFGENGAAAEFLRLFIRESTPWAFSWWLK